MATTVTINWKNGQLNFEGERKFTVPNADGERIRRCYDHCFGCDGDNEAIFQAILNKMMGALIDQVHEYELSNVADPIVPTPE